MGRKILLVVAVITAVSLNGAARADITNSTSTNMQQGNQTANANQHGGSTSGAAVGGQVSGVVSSGRTSVDATNRSANSSVGSGDVVGSNSAHNFTGQNSNDPSNVVTIGDITNSTGTINVQEGNNRSNYSQAVSANSGDGVAGQVIGVVTAAGGSTSVVADNTSENVDVLSGDSRATNDESSFVGQTNCGGQALTITSDISNMGRGCNFQEGNNRLNANQTVTSTSGDAVAGEVIGVVSAGATSVDARNRSTNSDITSGDATAANSLSAFAGQSTCGGDTSTVIADINNVRSSCNVQEGNNTVTSNQPAAAKTGDAVGGQVIGAVTSGGASLSIVADNGSDNVSVQTGDASASDAAAAFAGQSSCGGDDLTITSDITNVFGGCNFQEGDNRITNDQTSNATSGDGVAGQVIGAVSAGASSIDARNRSTNTDVTTGDADAANTLSAFVGQDSCGGDTQTVVADISNVSGCSMQEGNNRLTNNQSSSAKSGAGVGGEVIGAVTSAGGSTSIVADNTSSDDSVTTGEAAASAHDAAILGQSSCGGLDQTITTDISNLSFPCLVQEGDNRLTNTQTSSATTGDGVAGQVVGAVSAGRTSIDARNSSTSTDVTTGDATATDSLSAFVGLNNCTEGTTVITGDISNVTGGCDFQDGSNRLTNAQSATANTGDGVGGQVIGAVTSAGGSASIVADNATTNSDITTGDASATNDAAAFVGLNDQGTTTVAADITNVCPGRNCEDLQNGSNRLTLSQTAVASSGDGVGGQVLGVVSAGAASVDATNRSTDNSVETGQADAANHAAEFVGQNFGVSVTVVPADVSGSAAGNIQDGSNRKTLTQTASATSGDGVAGQVSGVVTSAGGSASVVVANTSTGIDSTSGESVFDNTDTSFVGQSFTTGPLTVA